MKLKLRSYGSHGCILFRFSTHISLTISPNMMVHLRIPAITHFAFRATEESDCGTGVYSEDVR